MHITKYYLILFNIIRYYLLCLYQLKKIIMTKLSDLIKHLEDMGAVYDRYGVRYTIVGEPYGMLNFLKAYGVDTHFYIDYEVERAIIKEGYIITFLDIEGQFINTKIKKHEKIND